MLLPVQEASVPGSVHGSGRSHGEETVEPSSAAQSQVPGGGG